MATFVYYDRNRPKKRIPEFASERPVETGKIQSGDIWLHASRSFPGVGIRFCTLSDINHAGQIVDDNYMIHASKKGLIKEPFMKYVNNPKYRPTIVRIKDELFSNKEEKKYILGKVIEEAEKLYSLGMGYDYGLIRSFLWRSLLKKILLYRVKIPKHLVGKKHEVVVCSQFIDVIWDVLEKENNLDLFIPEIHPSEVTPMDIILSSNTVYVTGWYYKDYFEGRKT